MILDAPTRARLEAMSLSSRRRVQGRFTGRHRSRRYGDSMDFADYRPYVPGDDYRRIDHNMRARLGVTMVRLFESEDELPVRLIIDRSASMAFDGKMTAAREVGAVIAYAALAGGDRVIPHATPGTAGRSIDRAPSGSHLASWPQLESWLEDLDPSGEAPPGSVLRRVILEGGTNGPVVLVSDLMVPAWEELVAGVGVASGGLVVHVLAPSEERPEVVGDVRLVDAETGRHVDVSASRKATVAYADRFARFVLEASLKSRRVGMDYLRVNSGADVVAASIGALAQQGVLA